MKPTLGIYGIQDQGTFAGPRWTHDHGLALIANGRLEWSLELERYTRKKHDNRLHQFIEPMLADGIISLPHEFNVVAVDSFVGTAFLSSGGQWRIEGAQGSLPIHLPLRPARVCVGEDPLIVTDGFYCFQELAHVSANLPFTGGFEDGSLLFHIDGGASQSNASAFLYKDQHFQHLYHGWDTVWAIMNFGWNDLTHAMLGLNEDTRLSAPGKLMGYAAYGQDTPELRQWLRNNDWFRNHWLQPDLFFLAAARDLNWHGDGFDLTDSLLQDIAAACQAEYEEQVIGLLSTLQQRTGAQTLYAGGGGMLNVELNRKLIATGMFDRVFIPPCCSDSGLAIGAAALKEYLDRGIVEVHSPFQNNAGMSPSPAWGEPYDVAEVAQRLKNGQVIAWFVGASESGPRALGHRSILASPVSHELKAYVSEELKQREWYRPVAPIVLEELAENLFPGSSSISLTDYMLCNVAVSPGWRNRIPGVVHVDGTARVQVLRDGALEQKQLCDLLKLVWELHGLPCLINTSFNGPGEPIVHTAEEAKAAAKRLGVDVLVIDEHMETYVHRDLKRV